MYKNGVFHNDMKPKNVFIDKRLLAIIGDFGKKNEILYFFYYILLKFCIIIINFFIRNDKDIGWVDNENS